MSKIVIFPTPFLFRLKFGGVAFGVDPSYWRLESENVRLISREIISKNQSINQRVASRGKHRLTFDKVTAEVWGLFSCNTVYIDYYTIAITIRLSIYIFILVCSIVHNVFCHFVTNEYVTVDKDFKTLCSDYMYAVKSVRKRD